MTIKEYLQDLEKLPYKNKNGETLTDSILDAKDIWSNYAAKGYALIGMRGAGLQPEQIAEVLKRMSWAFDEKTVSEAEKFYDEYVFN